MNQGTVSTKAPRNPNRVAAQLRRRQAEKAALEADATKPTDVVNELQAEAAPAPADLLRNSGEGSERRALGKLRRAFKKAGKPKATEAELRMFLDALRAANVLVMNRTSGRIAKVVKGERPVESLLLERGGKNAG